MMLWRVIAGEHNGWLHPRNDEFYTIAEGKALLHTRAQWRHRWRIRKARLHPADPEEA